jgi:hypothetical protein
MSFQSDIRWTFWWKSVLIHCLSNQTTWILLTLPWWPWLCIVSSLQSAFCIDQSFVWKARHGRKVASSPFAFRSSSETVNRSAAKVFLFLLSLCKTERKEYGGIKRKIETGDPVAKRGNKKSFFAFLRSPKTDKIQNIVPINKQPLLRLKHYVKSSLKLGKSMFKRL